MFGLFCMLSLCFALQATLLSAGLFGMLNISGSQNVDWFVRKNWWLVDLPVFFCTVSILLMLVAAMVSIEGIINRWAFLFLLVVHVASVIFVAVVFFRVQRQMYSETVMLKHKRWSKNAALEVDQQRVARRLKIGASH